MYRQIEWSSNISKSIWNIIPWIIWAKISQKRSSFQRVRINWLLIMKIITFNKLLIETYISRSKGLDWTISVPRVDLVGEYRDQMRSAALSVEWCHGQKLRLFLKTLLLNRKSVGVDRLMVYGFMVWGIALLWGWFYDFMVYGFMALRLYGFRVLWFYGFLISKIPSFHFMFSGRYWSHIQDFKIWLDGSSGLFGARLFQNWHLWGFPKTVRCENMMF